MTQCDTPPQLDQFSTGRHSRVLHRFKRMLKELAILHLFQAHLPARLAARNDVRHHVPQAVPAHLLAREGRGRTQQGHNRVTARSTNRHIARSADELEWRWLNAALGYRRAKPGAPQARKVRCRTSSSSSCCCTRAPGLACNCPCKLTGSMPSASMMPNCWQRSAAGRQHGERGLAEHRQVWQVATRSTQQRGAGCRQAGSAICTGCIARTGQLTAAQHAEHAQRTWHGPQEGAHVGGALAQRGQALHHQRQHLQMDREQGCICQACWSNKWWSCC